MENQLGNWRKLHLKNDPNHLNKENFLKGQHKLGKRANQVGEIGQRKIGTLTK
jgi:hypothetical protein